MVLYRPFLKFLSRFGVKLRRRLPTKKLIFYQRVVGWYRPIVLNADERQGDAIRWYSLRILDSISEASIFDNLSVF